MDCAGDTHCVSDYPIDQNSYGVMDMCGSV